MTSDNCPHCGAALHTVRGASCPGCGGVVPSKVPGFSPRKVAGGLVMILGGLAGLYCGVTLMTDGFRRIGGEAGQLDPYWLATVGGGLASGALLWGVGRWIAGPLSTDRRGCTPGPGRRRHGTGAEASGQEDVNEAG